MRLRPRSMTLLAALIAGVMTDLVITVPSLHFTSHIAFPIARDARDDGNRHCLPDHDPSLGASAATAAAPTSFVCLSRMETVTVFALKTTVSELMKDGCSTEEIAGRLFISPVTVRTRVAAILRNLHVTTREAAVELIER